MKDGKTAKCQHIKDDGTRCQANAVTGSKFCFFHDPNKAKDRADARKRGGQCGKAAILPITTPDHRIKTANDIADLLAETINQVRKGEVDPKVANAVGYLSGVFLKAIDQGKIEDRLASLETIVQRQPRPSASAMDPVDNDMNFDRLTQGTKS